MYVVSHVMRFAQPNDSLPNLSISSDDEFMGEQESAAKWCERMFRESLGLTLSDDVDNSDDYDEDEAIIVLT